MKAAEHGGKICRATRLNLFVSRLRDQKKKKTTGSEDENDQTVYSWRADMRAFSEIAKWPRQRLLAWKNQTRTKAPRTPDCGLSITHDSLPSLLVFHPAPKSIRHDSSDRIWEYKGRKMGVKCLFFFGLGRSFKNEINVVGRWFEDQVAAIYNF